MATTKKKSPTRAELLKEKQLQAIQQQQAAQAVQVPQSWHFMVIPPEHLDLVFKDGRPAAGTEVKLVVSEIGTLGAVIDLVVVEPKASPKAPAKPKPVRTYSRPATKQRSTAAK